MKKLFYSAAIIATLASCAKNEVVAPQSPNQDVISFTTLNDRVASRSANGDSDDYRVFAIHNDGTAGSYAAETAWLMDEVLYGGAVGSAGTANTLISGNKYKWPATGSLDFIAYAPAPGAKTAGASYSDSDCYLSTGEPNTLGEDFNFNKNGEIKFTFESIKGDVDLTAAQLTTMTSGTVALKFRHLLSKIVVKVDLVEGLKDAGYMINNGNTDADLTTTFKVLKSRGLFTLSSYGKGSLEYAENAAAKSMKDCYSGENVNIVPQTSTGCTIQLHNLNITRNGVKVNTSDTPSYVIELDDISCENTVASEALASPIEDNKFTAGRVFVLNLLIDEDSYGVFGSDITFSAECEEWINANSATDEEWPADSTSQDDVDWGPAAGEKN